MVVRTPFHSKAKPSQGTIEFEECMCLCVCVGGGGWVCVCVLGDSFPLTREGFAGKGPNLEDYRK